MHILQKIHTNTVLPDRTIFVAGSYTRHDDAVHFPALEPIHSVHLQPERTQTCFGFKYVQWFLQWLVWGRPLELLPCLRKPATLVHTQAITKIPKLIQALASLMQQHCVFIAQQMYGNYDYFFLLLLDKARKECTPPPHPSVSILSSYCMQVLNSLYGASLRACWIHSFWALYGVMMPTRIGFSLYIGYFCPSSFKRSTTNLTSFWLLKELRKRQI